MLPAARGAVRCAQYSAGRARRRARCGFDQAAPPARQLPRDRHHLRARARPAGALVPLRTCLLLRAECRYSVRLQYSH